MEPGLHVDVENATRWEPTAAMAAEHRAARFVFTRATLRREPTEGDLRAMIESISAVTLATRDMPRAFEFYTMLGFELRYGGSDAEFTSFVVGDGHLNLIAASNEERWSWWGRVIFHVSDVDRFHRRAVDNGLVPEAPPRDARWGERYFHVTDPDGHELSFARPIT